MGLDSPGIVAVFWILSAVTVGASLAVFFSRDLIHAVVFLVLAFVATAGLFLTLSADFIAVAQVLIYAGAIPILIVFAVMLTPMAARDNANSLFVLPGVVIGALFAAAVIFIAVDVDWAQLSGVALAERSFPTTVGDIGDLLLGKYLLAFEVVSVLLLAALIGAIVLVREDESA